MTDPDQPQDEDDIMGSEMITPTPEPVATTVTSEDDEDVVTDDTVVVPDAPPVQSDDVSNDITGVPVTAESDDDLVTDASSEDTDVTIRSENEIEFDDSIIEFRGGSREELEELLKRADAALGPKGLDADVRTAGTWTNLLFRMHQDPNYEEIRIQKALSLFSLEELEVLRACETDKNGKTVFKANVLRNENGKILLRTARINKKLPPGSKVNLTGQEALLAFETEDQGGGWRIPLYNSGLTIDVMAPTGNDMQTMLYNCSQVDKEMGSRLGGHYFSYGDVMFKTQFLNFLQPLIKGSSFADWKRKDKLFSAIKLPDLFHIVATIAALCYPDGYPDFAVTCKRIPDETHPNLCAKVERINVDILKMIVTRWPAMSSEAVQHMTAARSGNVKHTAVEIAKYQAALGFEGEGVTFDNITFNMRIPSLNEHLEAGAVFLADIINEIEADNNQGRENQIGVRYMRTFLPWIASIEKRFSNGSEMVTSDATVILRALERLDVDDPDGVVRAKFDDYIGRVQLTYVGHPILPCSECGYVAQTPSGMWTFDPFATFFTLAFLYLKPEDSSEKKTA